MTTLDFETMDAIATIIAEHARNTVAPLIKRVEALEESQKHFRYCGVYEQGREYMPQNFVTRSGAMWSCLRATTSRPGDSDAWQLAVKSPRA
jgi:hypothetical protein